MRFIPTKVHGALDYIVGIALIAAPWLFGFAGVGGAAVIIPVVLGSKGEPLDLGRSRRLFSPAQRKAMALRDRGCRGEGCSVPARRCEAHHDQPWALGGKTNIKDGRFYCNWHHHLAHDPRYQATLLPNGDVRFTRRR